MWNTTDKTSAFMELYGPIEKMATNQYIIINMTSIKKEKNNHRRIIDKVFLVWGIRKNSLRNYLN